MQASARGDLGGDPDQQADTGGRTHRRLVRVIAPGVCYLLVEPKDIARVLAARPEARIRPLAERAAWCMADGLSRRPPDMSGDRPSMAHEGH